MKKTLFVLLACLLGLSLVACSQPKTLEMTDEEILAAAEEILAEQGKVIVDESELVSADESVQEVDSDQTEAPTVEPTEEPTPEDSVGERKNPAGIGDVITVTTYDSLIEIELLEIIRGQDALEIAKDANPYNEVDEGKEIIMAKFKITNLEDLSGEDETYLASYIQFDYSDSNFAVDFSFASVAGLDDELLKELYEGASTEGFVCFLANEGELQPYAVFEDSTWFDISGSIEAE